MSCTVTGKGPGFDLLVYSLILYRQNKSSNVTAYLSHFWPEGRGRELSTAQALKCKLIFLCDISVYILFIKFI